MDHRRTARGRVRYEQPAAAAARSPAATPPVDASMKRRLSW